MNKKIICVLLITVFIGCKSKEESSRKVGVNTSRSGIKNNVDTDEKKKENENQKKEEEKK